MAWLGPRYSGAVVIVEGCGVGGGEVVFGADDRKIGDGCYVWSGAPRSKRHVQQVGFEFTIKHRDPGCCRCLQHKERMSTDVIALSMCVS